MLLKINFTETKEFIDDSLKEECEKDKITADEVIFLQVKKQRISLEKHFCFRFVL